MFSELIKEALERDVVGQPQAINSVVRGVTRLISGLTPRERSWCAYLFIGPPGTGRAHLVRTLARLLHGDETLIAVSCNPGGRSDPWMWFVEQLGPFFATRQSQPSTITGSPPGIILVQDLECARPEFFPMLARVLETGQLALPGGRLGRLNDCMVFLTSGLCTHEILETSRIGFSPASAREANGGEEDDSIMAICRAEAEKVFGLELLAQIDNLIVFRRLEEEHLAGVLERHFARMSRWLAQSGVHCEMEPAAKALLLERGNRQPLIGARNLIQTHRREVEFPLADLLLSGQLAPGGHVVVDHRPGEGHLHFTVETPRESSVGGAPIVREIPVA